MKKIYLDNAATTALDPQVLEAMMPYLLNHYGNPSSSHYAGREAKAGIESARKSIALQIGAKSSRLIFTSGATESNNLVFKFAQKDLGIQHVIVSPLEHHAVLYTAQQLFGSNVHYVSHSNSGEVDLLELEKLLVRFPNSLVSIMHANNEIGIINPIKEISVICKKYHALLHSDTVQSIAHQTIDVENLGLDFMVCSAHKFHGPKGVGFLAMGKDFVLTANQYGGTQEKNLRAGTENVASIVGMAKALELVLCNLEQNENHIKYLKKYLVKELSQMNGISFNAHSDSELGILPSILNINLPKDRYNEMTLFSLDLSGIAVSGGSACGSGALKGSHVLSHLNPENNQVALRISFSKFNTVEELDYFMEVLKRI